MVLVGNYIRETRVNQGYSVEQFAQATRLQAEKIFKFERGKILPSKWQLLQMAGLFGIDEKKLLIAHQQQLIANGSENGHPVSERSQLLSKELQQWQEKPSSVKLFPLNGQLADYLESIIYFESLDQYHAYEKVMPDGMPQLIINLDEPSSIIIGQHDIPLCLLLKKNIRKIIVRFQPYGLYLLTGIPQDYLLNRTLDAEHIFGRSINQLCEELLSCQDPIQLQTLLSRFFTERIPAAETHLVERRVIHFVVSNINEPIGVLVKKSGYSSKHLIHLFRTYTGLTPKVFQQIRQFAASINEMSLLPTYHLAGTAWSQDYYDSAHFIRQFTRFSGFTPTEYLKTGNTCSRMVHYS